MDLAMTEGRGWSRMSVLATILSLRIQSSAAMMMDPTGETMANQALI